MKSNLARTIMIASAALSATYAGAQDPATLPIPGKVYQPALTPYGGIDPAQYTQQPDVKASVMREPDGRLILRWTVPAKSVQIYATSSPSKSKGSTPLMTVEDQTQAVLPAPDPTHRIFYHLVFKGGEMNGKTLVVADRYIPLEGAANFRDLGGYPTEDGKHVRWGVAFRSDGMQALTSRDLDYLGTMKLKLDCDLRGPDELKTDPDRVPQPARWVNYPIGAFDDGGAPPPTGTYDEQAEQGYAQTAIRFGKKVYGPMLEEYAKSANLPIVTHCAAGKDRTGIATALLLTVLRVPKSTIVADYTLTNYSYDNLYADILKERATNPKSTFAQMDYQGLLAKPEWIGVMLDILTKKYGSMDNFFHDVCGVSEETEKKIRAYLLE